MNLSDASFLLLEKYGPDDFDMYYDLVRRDTVMKYITGQGLTLEEAKTKFDAIVRINQTEEGLGYFKVIKGDAQHIGDCKLEHYDRDREQLLEIGYILKEEFWGQGYGTMLCERMLAVADWVAPTMDVIGIIDPENAASKRLLEKFGFKSYFIGMEDDLATEKFRLYRKGE